MTHKDDQLWLDTLLSHLSWLQRKHGIDIWTDRNIEVGARWHETIQSELDRAKVAVLLVSPDFLASSYITNDELPKMLQAAESEGMTIFWIPVRPSAYKHSPIDREHCRPQGRRTSPKQFSRGVLFAKSILSVTTKSLAWCPLFPTDLIGESARFPFYFNRLLPNTSPS